MFATAVSSAEELAEHVAAWEDLVTSAIEPNVFYEPFTLLPALRAFGIDKDLTFVLVWGSVPSKTVRRRALHGLFPLVRQASSRAVPLKTLASWTHDYAFLSTPLIRTDSPVDCLRTFFDWVASERGDTKCIEITDVSGDGPFWHYLTEYLSQSGRTTWLASSHTRAVFRPRGDAESYVQQAIAGKHRKELRRQERLLSEAGGGPVTIAKLAPTDDVRRWIADFLQIEASGWKGRRGTAMSINSSHRRFFEEMATGAFERGRLHMMSLSVGSRVIASKFNLLAGQGGGFAFKIAFDEEFGRFSPGVHLELQAIHDFFEMKTSWIDSCASAEHPMINRLWLDRRLIQSVFISMGKKADLVLSMMPILRLAKREVLNRKLRETEMISKDEPVGGAPAAKAASEPLVIDGPEFAATFTRKPFVLGHHLSDHPLFKLPRLIDLARRMPASDVEYNAGNLPVTQDPTQTPRNGLSIEETVRRIDECKSWMVLKFVERDPEYRALLDRCLDQVSGHSQYIAPGMHTRSAFIFVTSPGSVTPYHMDPEHNFLLQIRGKKEIHVFDGDDRSILSEGEIERYLTGAHRNLVFKDEYQTKAFTFELDPGKAVHVPVTFPHWVKNGNEVSISFSITFRTPSSERRAAVYRMNSMLRRRLPLQPRPYGGADWRDTVKYNAYRAVQYAERMAEKIAQRRGRAEKEARY